MVSLWQYYRDEPNATITDSKSFEFKARIIGRTPVTHNAKDVEITVPLKYFFDQPVKNDKKAYKNIRKIITY